MALRRLAWIAGAIRRILSRLRADAGPGLAINAKRQIADPVARAEAKAVVERSNEQLSASRDMLSSPTIRAALIACNENDLAF
jgi:hypothetical protein